jgi:protease-4
MMKRVAFWFVVFLFIFVILPVGGVLLWMVVQEVDLLAKPNRLGVIEVNGMIKNGTPVLEALKKFGEDPNIRSVVVRIESPGGGVGPSQEIYREVRRFRSLKPVVASLGSIAASGGYYVAAACNTIVANPGTLTGSIGVVVHLPKLQGLFDRIGYETVTIKSGPYKDIGNPGRDITEEERRILEETVDAVHRQFVKDVAEARGLPEEAVRSIADGRILTGEHAQSLGLVDELGNLEDAFVLAAKLGGIEGKPVIVYAEKKKVTLWDVILSGSFLERFRTALDPSEAVNPLRYQWSLWP